MKSIFNKGTRDEVIIRINSLHEASKAQWGKMTVAQMVRHCRLCEEYYYGSIHIKRSFLGRLLGRVAINAILKDDINSFRKNASTPSELEVNELNLDLESEKASWKSLIEKYETFKSEGFKHWFFGKMTREQLGQFIYKHGDHHLRQFGV
jgi:Protein of unknown function (DUF1569)